MCRSYIGMSTPVARGGNRRSFVKEFLAGSIGLLLGIVPFAAGLVAFMDPLRRKSGTGQAVRVTTLDALPADGIPRKFSVVDARVDAWNKFPETPIGAVYLR